MGKVSQNERQSKNGRQKRLSKKANNKYLKPGALQLRVRRAAGSKSCTDLGKKRVAVNNAKQSASDDSETNQNQNIDKTPTRLSPARFQFAPVFEPSDVFDPNNLGNMTPRTEECEPETESRLESLPAELLVKILCHLHHDQLRAVFHVSKRIRKAVVQARKYYFNFTTPDRSRQEMLNALTPLQTEHWPFMSKGGGNGIFIASPHTPKAPKHGPRPPSRLKLTEIKQVAAVLFKETIQTQPKFSVSSVIQKPICKSLASNRVLFYEDELCQAVAQNKLR